MEREGQPHSSVPRVGSGGFHRGRPHPFFGVLLAGYNDQEAGTAESVIAVVLLAGLTSLLPPDWTRRAGILVQGFALVGTVVGLTVLVTLGPRTVLDIAIHVVMVALLVSGLIVTTRAPATFQAVSHRVTDTANRR